MTNRDLCTSSLSGYFWYTAQSPPLCRNRYGRRNDIILLHYGFIDETAVTSKFGRNIEHLVTLPFSPSSHSQVVRITVHYACVTTLCSTRHVPLSFGDVPKRYVKHVTALRIWYGYVNKFLLFLNNVSCGQAITHFLSFRIKHFEA